MCFDSLEGELTYSPDELTFSRGKVRRGALDASIELALELDDWGFVPESTWSADVSLEATPVDALQQFLRSPYPVRGQLSGQFHGRGTRAAPTVTGLFDLANGDATELRLIGCGGNLI